MPTRTQTGQQPKSRRHGQAPVAPPRVVRHPVPDRLGDPRRPAQRFPTRRPPPPHACHRRPPLPPSPCPMHGVPAERRQDDCPIANKAPSGRLPGSSGRADRRLRRPRHRDRDERHGPAGPGGDPEGRHRRRSRRLRHRRLQARRPQARRQGSQLRRPRGGDLQPVRHVVTRPRRRPGREHPDLPRPRQRLAQPVSPVHGHVEGRHGPQRQLGPRQLEHEVLRRVLHGAAGPRVARGRRAQPPVLRLGQQRVGRRQPDPGDRQEAGRQLRVRVHQGRVPRPCSPAASPTSATSSRACSRARRSMSMSDLFWTDPTRTVRYKVSFDSRRINGVSARMDPYKAHRYYRSVDRTAQHDGGGLAAAADRQRPWRNHANGAGQRSRRRLDSRWVRLRRAAIRRARRPRSAPRPARRGTGTRRRPPRAARPRRRPRTPRGSR